MSTKYGVILADPPWSYRNSGCRGAASNQYETQEDNWVYDLPILNLAAENSVLLLWATWPKLAEAMEVVTQWGFTYKTAFPWLKVTDCSQTLWGEWELKPVYGIGFWVRGASEPLLIGTKGRVSPPDAGIVGLAGPNIQHSRKPDHVHQYAELLPGPYLELFARRRREGWDVYGNQVEESIKLPDGPGDCYDSVTVESGAI